MTTATRTRKPTRATTRRKPAASAAAPAEKFDAYREVTDQIIALLEAGTAPWQQPWAATAGVMPSSLSTGKPYRGINPFLLSMASMAKGYTNPWWGTYDQITSRGGQVRKGEKSTMIVFWKRFETKEIDPETGKPKPAIVLRVFRVFNVQQADPKVNDDGTAETFNVPATPEALTYDHDPIEAAEQAIAGYLATGPALRTGTAAFYQPSSDILTMPPLATFASPEGYHSTLFHELAHSTGHRSRLNRPGVTTEGVHFGDHLYGKEELVAEMTAAMVSGMVGILPATVHNSAAYLDNWSKALKGDHKLVVQAAAQAQRAADLILSVTHGEVAEG